MKITILCTNINHPVIDSLKSWMNEIIKKGHSVSLVFDKQDLQSGDILFLVSCSQVIQEIERKNYKATLVLHASDLPKGRGWSPHIWSVLNGEDKVTVCVLEAGEPVDCGKIWLKKTFFLEGHELLSEINEKLFSTELSLMTEIVEKFDSIKPYQQKGESGPYMQRRTAKDSMLDPSISIAEQFELLRVVDSERYPAFFDYRGKRYSLKIEKI